MKFCRQCGKTVAIFDDSGSELCPVCAAEKTAAKDRFEAEMIGPANLLDATVCIKDDTIILESREGLLLWSGGGDRRHSLKTMLDRASKILAIRKKKR